MNDNISGFDERYVSGSTTSGSLSSNDKKGDMIIQEDTIEFVPEVETKRYGIGKPRRVVIRGKISE